MFEVTLKKSAEKSAKKMPMAEQAKLAQLMLALKQSGPVQPSFMNYSKLGEGDYHCHLSRKWVACWKNENGTDQHSMPYTQVVPLLIEQSLAS